MIDKVEVRIPGLASYSRVFDRLYRQIRNDPKGPFRPSVHYLAVADLRDYGYPVILHSHNVYDRHGNHKLELIDTGDRRYSEMVGAIQSVFDVNPEEIGLMRVDLAADVEGVPVAWFERNIRAKYKRWAAGIGMLREETEFSEMGSRGVQTFYLGKRPNVFRIYDKVAERQRQYFRLKLKAKRESDSPELRSFDEIFGHPETGYTLTRVERQIAGGRLPAQLSTFGQLTSAANFDPFAPLVYVGVGKPEPNPDDYDLHIYGFGMFLRSLVEREGIHRAWQFVNRHSQRNGARVLETYQDFLPDDGILISPAGLFDRYRQTVSAQLAA